MKAVTIREAKARLNALVEAAERGEQVVLMRGSKHVAAIVPLSEDDLELAPSLTDAQAERLWHQLEEERREGTMLVFEGVREAVSHLESPPPPPPARKSRGRRASRKTTGKPKR